MVPSLANIPFLNKRVKFPVTPHIPGGITSPDQLRQIADVAEKYGGSIKIVGASITILGLNLADGEKALDELGTKPESFIAKSIRGVAVCPGKPHCPMAQQDSVALALSLDNKFFGQPTPGKLRMGISGCPNCCAEVYVKDIGLFGTAEGYTLVLGGNAGRQARVAQEVAYGIPASAVASLISDTVIFYQQHGQTKERLGDTLDRVGWEKLIQEAIPVEYRK